MATTDISLVNNVVKITPQGYNSRLFSLKQPNHKNSKRC